jgi:hypothetical protein
MSNQVTRDNFSTDEEYADYQQRMQEMAASELQYNIQMLEGIRASQRETPCQTFYKMKKSIPLSVFIQVYPFNELVNCASNFRLEELMELKKIYSTLQQDDLSSFNRLQQMIDRITTPQAPPTALNRFKNLFGLKGGRRTMKKMYKKRSKSRSKKSQYKKSKSRSRSRSKK